MGCLAGMNGAAGHSDRTEVSASPELCFLAYGGFFLLDSERKVVAVQAETGKHPSKFDKKPVEQKMGKTAWKAVTGDTTQASLKFEGPRKWREVWTLPNTGGRFDERQGYHGKSMDSFEQGASKAFTQVLKDAGRQDGG